MQTRRLIWARHGEADNLSALGDFDRPLAPRGQQQAISLGQQLHAQSWLPQHTFSSSARRALDTAQIILHHLSPACPLESDHSLYLGNLLTVQQLLAQYELDSYDTLLLVGHNPGWSIAAQQLSGSLVSLGNASAALLSVQADDWNVALHNLSSWTLHAIVHPV